MKHDFSVGDYLRQPVSHITPIWLFDGRNRIRGSIRLPAIRPEPDTMARSLYRPHLWTSFCWVIFGGILHLWDWVHWGEIVRWTAAK